MKLPIRTFANLSAVAVLAAAASTAQAAVCDLTAESSCVINTIYGPAIFTTDFTRPAGTGVIDPFLSIQANGTEQGYNTSAKQGVFDTKREPKWNHELRLSDLATVTIEGVDYYSFVIDINEPNSTDKSMISIDAIKIFSSPKAGQTTKNVESLGVKRFDLDLPEDSYIKYNDLNSGSGQGDIAFFIPTAAFLSGPNPVKSTDYIYMYQKFGASIAADSTLTTQGGFEETFIGRGVVPIPEVSAVLPLSGVVLLAVGAYRRRRAL